MRTSNIPKTESNAWSRERALHLEREIKVLRPDHGEVKRWSVRRTLRLRKDDEIRAIRSEKENEIKVLHLG